MSDILGTGLIRFDGNNDMLQIPDNVDFELGANDFTMEMIIQPLTTTVQYQALMTHCYDSATDLAFGLYLNYDTIYFEFKIDGLSTYSNQFAGGNIPTDSISHIAIVRNGNNIYCYVEGVQIDTALDISSYGTTVIHNSSYPISLGSRNDYLYDYNGLMGEVRLSNTARYTSNFTPPTTQHIADVNTKLLIQVDGDHGDTVFVDKSGSANAIQPRVGTGYGVFDGTNAQLRLPDSTDWQFGTGDFTIEFDVYEVANILNTNRIVETTDWSANGGFLITDATTNKFRFYDGNTDALEIEADNTFVKNQWYHIAVVRFSNTITMYIDGVAQTQTHIAGDYYNQTMSIGGTLDLVSTEFFKGLLSEFRVSDIARYTSNFTPPSGVHVNDANTLLLLHMDGTDRSTTFTDSSSTGHVPTVNGNAHIRTINHPVLTVNNTTTIGSDVVLAVTSSNLEVDIERLINKMQATSVFMDVDIARSINKMQATSVFMEIDISTEQPSRLKWWNGSEWQIGILKYWDGATWTPKPLKYWTGSEWSE